jgi:4-amino-4-deoxy-L-arabinose transferase-like glycosyltransferase
VTRSHLLVFAVLFAALILLHIPYLSLPYFWDELGQFVPAALDILKDNAWVPHRTVPNVHPPGVMAYLALVWKVAGCSVVATRIAMLAVAAAGCYAAFLLAIRVSRQLPGAPAFMSVGLLIATPLFYMQALMAQLDMPAMTLTVVAMLLFLERRFAWCVAACTALVLVKETGVLAPALFAGWLVVRERDWKRAVPFAIPFAALAVWLFVLWRATGHILGDPGFAHYNVGYSLHPVRAGLTILRRFYYLFVADFRWIGAIAILWGLRRTRWFHTRDWLVIGLFSAAHVLVVSVFGGAALERYLLPVFPFLYIAVATGWAAMAQPWRRISEVALLAGLFTGLYWNPPFPFPLENNLAMADFVELQKKTAEYLDDNMPRAKVASAWPYTGALRNPELGFTRTGYRVVETNDFHPKNVIDACKADPPDVLVVYSRTWEPHWGVMGNAWVTGLLRRYYDYERQISTGEVQAELGMSPVLRWEQRGQFIELFTR